MKSIILVVLPLLLAVLATGSKHHLSLRTRHQNKLRLIHKLETQLLQVKTDVTVKKEGWLRIQTPDIKNLKRYPPIPQANGGPMKVFKIGVVGDKESDKPFMNMTLHPNGIYRKNSKFQKGGPIPSIDALYFRVTPQALYYTESKESTTVLGAIAVKNIIGTVGAEGPGCFKVADEESDGWHLCTLNNEASKPWICAIMEVLGKPCKPPGPQVITKKVLVKEPVIIIPLPSPDCARDWNYNAHGKNWVCRCNEGSQQSPIDLPKPSCLQLVRMNAQFEYNAVKREHVKIVYDRNLIRIKVTEKDVIFGKLTDIDGTVYESRSIWIHTPAEHTIGGQTYDMEVQIIHKCVKGDFKRKAVLSILYQNTPGTTVQAFEEMDILNLPNPIMTEATEIFKHDIHVMKFLYNDDQYTAPPPFNYYKYMGSITTPPCEENVVWFVAADPVPLGSTQLYFLRNALNLPKGFTEVPRTNPFAPVIEGSLKGVPDNYDGSNRDVQPLRNRGIWYYDRTQSCMPFIENKGGDKMVGHYEKVIKKVEKIFYVDSDKPSGLSEAFIIGEKEATSSDPTTQVNIGEMRKTDRYMIHN